jgi:hypothetical protein
VSEEEEDVVTDVVVDGKVVDMGPWSCMAEDWFIANSVFSSSPVSKHEPPAIATS